MWRNTSPCFKNKQRPCTCDRGSRPSRKLPVYILSATFCPMSGRIVIFHTGHCRIYKTRVNASHSRSQRWSNSSTIYRSLMVQLVCQQYWVWNYLGWVILQYLFKCPIFISKIRWSLKWESILVLFIFKTILDCFIFGIGLLWSCVPT